MKCPHCGYNDSKVLDSRDVDDGVRRRRQCLSCDSRFTTYERVQKTGLFVIKKDKRRELFNKNKLLNGIRKAFEKRPVAANMIDKVADDIEAELFKQGRQEVQSAVIGDMVMTKLKQIDQIAYIRFASVYRDFADITKLKQEVDNLARGISRTIPAEQLPLLPENETEIMELGSRGKRK
ncbi:MAG: transcriptional regulator NrdR [Dehalococcoidales bacterium]